jgi:hypothetical protein
LTVARYTDTVAFAADTLDILMADEVQNCLPIFFIGKQLADNPSNLFATVKDANRAVVLTAVCTPPHNIVLYETGNKPCGGAAAALCAELKSAGFVPTGVMAERNLALRFADAYAGTGCHAKHKSLVIMRLDTVNDMQKAPGHHRLMRPDEMYYMPYWMSGFEVDCNLRTTELCGLADNLNSHLERQTKYIWEDGHPVSTAHLDRTTPNGGCVSGVYTPPYYRGKGYASSLVAELSRIVLERGFRFAFLFADAANPISCGIYRKIGYRDVCVVDEIYIK